jgi:hypothetical protein
MGVAASPLAAFQKTMIVVDFAQTCHVEPRGHIFPPELAGTLHGKKSKTEV